MERGSRWWRVEVVLNLFAWWIVIIWFVVDSGVEGLGMWGG